MNLSNEIVVFVIEVVVLAEITNHCAGETLVSLSSHSPDFLSSSLRTSSKFYSCCLPKTTTIHT